MNEYEVSGIENIARGVCIVDGKVLLCKPKSGAYTYLPGGHIEFGEKGCEALVREIKEEMGLESEAGELLGVEECQFEQHGKPHAEINLIFKLTLLDGVSGQADNDAGASSDVRRQTSNVIPLSREDWIAFEWRDISDLGNANLLPPEMAKYVRG